MKQTTRRNALGLAGMSILTAATSAAHSIPVVEMSEQDQLIKAYKSAVKETRDAKKPYSVAGQNHQEELILVPIAVPAKLSKSQALKLISKKQYDAFDCDLMTYGKLDHRSMISKHHDNLRAVHCSALIHDISETSANRIRAGIDRSETIALQIIEDFDRKTSLTTFQQASNRLDKAETEEAAALDAVVVYLRKDAV